MQSGGGGNSAGHEISTKLAGDGSGVSEPQEPIKTNAQKKKQQKKNRRTKKRK